MVTHAELFNRAAESYDFAAIWTIEAQIEQDLDTALAEYQKAIEVWELASAKHRANCGYDFEYDLAYIDMQKKYVAYLEKHMIHDAFYGYYKKG